MLNTKLGCTVVAAKARSANLARMPASRAEAKAIGMRLIKRSNRPETPDNHIRTPQAKKAPTASGRLTPVAEAAITAAPGVDQVMRMGARVRSDNPNVVRPMPKPQAHTHELIWSGDALSDRAA